MIVRDKKTICGFSSVSCCSRSGCFTCVHIIRIIHGCSGTGIRLNLPLMPYGRRFPLLFMVYWSRYRKGALRFRGSSRLWLTRSFDNRRLISTSYFGLLFRPIATRLLCFLSLIYLRLFTINAIDNDSLTFRRNRNFARRATIHLSI